MTHDADLRVLGDNFLNYSSFESAIPVIKSSTVSIKFAGAMIMKDRVNKRTKMNMEAEERRLAHIKQHVAKLKAEHDSRNDFDFGTKGTNFTSHYFPHFH